VRRRAKPRLCARFCREFGMFPPLTPMGPKLKLLRRQSKTPHHPAH
jgi:hypothetical protein